jgi:hypothetical protein
LAITFSERSSSQLVGRSGNLGMASSLARGLLLWWNGEQLLKKTLAWFASKLHLVFGERVTYDVVLLFLGFASLVTCTVILCSFVHRYIENEKIGRGLPCRFLKKKPLHHGNLLSHY